MDLRFIAVLFLLKYGRLTGWFFKAAGEDGYSTGRSLCSTLVENTICVLVRPNCWSSLMKWSSSMVERKATSMSME